MTYFPLQTEEERFLTRIWVTDFTASLRGVFCRKNVEKAKQFGLMLYNNFEDVCAIEMLYLTYTMKIN